jgi:hypothetical protein
MQSGITDITAKTITILMVANRKTVPRKNVF